MALASTPNSRASLLAGLRTGGVRSVSAVPHTAALGSSFKSSCFASQHNPSVSYENEVENFHLPFNHFSDGHRIPMTAAVDGFNNNFASQQQTGSFQLNPHSSSFSPANSQNVFNANQMQTQAFQMQMLQLEMLRIQNIQARERQAEMLCQTPLQSNDYQVHGQHHATAANSIDLRPLAMAAPVRRANQLDSLQSRPGQGAFDEIPMTAALGGKFGSRAASLNVSSGKSPEGQDAVIAPTTNSTTVISGGISLGNPTSNNINSKTVSGIASKSDSAATWRRAGQNSATVIENSRAVSSPTVKITPPVDQSNASHSNTKSRPHPLRFSPVASQLASAVGIEVSDGNDTDDASSSSAASNSSPNTPRSSSSNGTSFSPPEEVSKKLYDGVGIGLPTGVQPEPQRLSLQHPLTTSVGIHRMASQPTRQPRGPPSGADELGPKNFASRIRRQAIDGLGMLMDARERRELVEAY